MKLSPPQNAKGGTSSPNVSDLVWYEQDGNPLLAIVIANKQKLVLLNERAREVELPPVRVSSLPGRLPTNLQTTVERASMLADLHARATKVSEAFDVKALWETVATAERIYPLDELVDLAGNIKDPESYFAILLSLRNDRIFFKRDKAGFIPRPATTVDEMHRQEAAKVQKQKARTTLIEWMRGKRDGRAEPVPESSHKLLSLLEDFAVGNPHLEQGELREAKEFTEECLAALKIEGCGSRDHRASDLLEAIGHFSPRTNFVLLRHRPRIEFPVDALREAHALRVPRAIDEFPTNDRSSRVDLTQLHTITIDDPSTLDMDDALSLEQTVDGFNLGVHISDVAGTLDPHGAIDAESAARATSIYLPERTLPMLPPILSEDKLSLRKDEVRPCLSCLFELSPNFEVRTERIVPSIIKVAQRLSYDQVEALLDANSPLATQLYQIAAECEHKRIERGALKVFKRDLLVYVDDAGHCSIREFDEHGPARSLVGEMMILANSLLARYAAEHSLPVVYRRQEGPDDDQLSAESPVEGPAADYAERSRLKKSTTSLEPGRHASLGLDAYIQGTSPIRRYLDLCNQRQILHHLRSGQPFYSADEMETILAKTDEPLANANALSRGSKRFWLLRYLEQRLQARQDVGKMKYDQIRGTVLRTDLKNPLIELDEVFLSTIARIPFRVSPGDALTFKIVGVDARGDYLRLEALQPRP